MCEPVSGGLAAAGFAIQGAQALTGYSAAKQQAEETNRNSYLQGLYNNMALAQTYNSMNLERTQARNMASQGLFETRLRGAEAKATARTAGGEAGIDGSNALDGLLQTYAMKEGMATSAIGENYSNESMNIQQREEAAYRGTENVNRNLPRVKPPSFFDTALKIAGAGVNAAGTYYGYRNRMSGPNRLQQNQASHAAE